MKLYSTEFGRDFEATPGSWLPWIGFPPPKDIGPILCERGSAGRVIVDPSTVDPAWNVAGVNWQVPRTIDADPAQHKA